jgi:hypothetical protein
VLPKGTYALTIKPKGTDPNSSGDLNVTHSVTIAGASTASTAISAGKIDLAGNKVTRKVTYRVVAA